MFHQNTGYSPDDGVEGEQGLGMHSPNQQSMRQPVHQSGAGNAYGAGQVVVPPQPLPTQLWQRANAMPLQHGQLQQQGGGGGGPAGPLGGGSSSLFGSLHQQQGGGMQQQLSPQLQQHGLGQLHATDSLLAAATMQQQDRQHQQPSTSSLLNEFYQQQQQQRIPNTMGLHAASVSAGSSSQALQNMLGQQQMLLHQHQHHQHQQLNLQQPQQSQFQGMGGGGSSWLNQQAGSGNMFGLSESSAWQSTGGNRLASLQGFGGDQQQQLMGGNEPYSSMASMMASGDASGMLSNQAYSSLLQQSQSQSTTPDLMGRLQLQLEQQQQLQIQQQLLQQQQDLQGQARRSSSMSGSSLIGQANNPSLWQQHQQQQSQHHHLYQQQDQPPPSTMPQSMQTFLQSQLNSSVIPSEGDELVKRKVGKKRAKTFPEKLMQAMMDQEDEEAFGWLPDGRSFVIVSPDRFVQDILNKVFKQAKYASFIRKLHRWGFMRLTSGTGTDCFHHPLFQKNRKDLASKIICSTKDKPQAAAMLLGTKGAGGMRGMGFLDAKPPSLAGVEKFIRAKAAASSAVAATSRLPIAAVGQPEGSVAVPKEPPQSQAPAAPQNSLQTLSAIARGNDEKGDNDIVTGAYVEGDSVEEV